MKNKMRSMQSAKKRIFFLTSGKCKRWQANTSHLAFHKTTKRKRHLRKKTFLSDCDWGRFKKVFSS